MPLELSQVCLREVESQVCLREVDRGSNASGGARDPGEGEARWLSRR